MSSGGKTVVIYNPRAGKLRRNGQVELARAAEALARAGRTPVLVPTTGPGTAGALAARAAEGGAGLILAAGGDGTLNEVLEGMVHTAVPLGVLPAGTANVFANEVGLPRGIVRAAAGLSECLPCRVPIGRVRYPDGAVRHFLLMAGAGLDARIVYDISGPLKDKVGKLAYWAAGLRLAASRLEEFRICAGGCAYTCSFALVSKVRNYGGDLRIARSTSLFDDRFELVLFTGRHAVGYARYLAGVALGRVAGMRGVTVLRAREATLEAPHGRPVYIQVDGELAGRLPVVIDTVPDALTVLVPRAYAARFG